MLKLMKYEFRKLRTPLLVMVLILAGLEIGFLAGYKLEKAVLTAISVTLLTTLVFVSYAFLLIAGIVSYSKELTDKSGYLAFMVPVRPISIVLSKLLFTALAAIAATALFAVAAWADIGILLDRFNIGPALVEQANALLRLALKGALPSVQQTGQFILYIAGTVFIEFLLAICSAYLAITLSATLLQNRKGFLRAMISLLLFVALNWGASWLADKLFYQHASVASSVNALLSSLGGSLLMNLALCAVFTTLAAWLLDRKVNL